MRKLAAAAFFLAATQSTACIATARVAYLHLNAKPVLQLTGFSRPIRPHQKEVRL
jgi:hypothetical protein